MHFIIGFMLYQTTVTSFEKFTTFISKNQVIGTISPIV